MPDFASVLSELAPVGYWRLGESSGTTMYDLSGMPPRNGTYSRVDLRTPGAVGGDRDTAVSFNGRPSYGEIPDHKAYSLTRAWDNFNRASAFGRSWGDAAGGETWEGQVSTRAFYRTTGRRGIIDPHGTRGTYQQGLPTKLLSGDMQVRATWSEHAGGGALQPVALVAQRVDNANFVRAELLEHATRSLEIQLIRTVNGQDEQLASRILERYALGEWYYLRFQFDGANLRARAWRRSSIQPTEWDVTAKIPIAETGTIAIRSANSGTGQTARPVVQFEGFWAQTIGLTIHVFLKLDRTAQSADRVYPLGKGAKSKGVFAQGNREYYLRYHRETDELKAYTFNLEGGLGAGINMPEVGNGQWHQVVFMLDSGDALDTRAGVTAWLDGERVGGAPDSGAKYDGGQSWQVYPLSGDGPVRLGSLDEETFFTGSIDELALFSRKLTDDEIRTLWTAAESGEDQAPVLVDRSAEFGTPPAAGKPTGVVLPGLGSQNIGYRDSSNRLHELWRDASGATGTSNLTALAGAPAATGNPFAYVDTARNTVILLFRGSDGTVRSLYWSQGRVGHDDLGGFAGAPKAAGDPVGYYVPSADAHHVVYAGAGAHLHELNWTGVAPVVYGGNLTGAIGAPPAAGTPAAFAGSDGLNIVVYRTSDKQVLSVYWADGPSGLDNLSGVAGTPPAADDPVAYYTAHDDAHQVVYRADDDHLHELYWHGVAPVTGWDLTAAAAAPPAAGSGAPAAYYSPATNTKHVVYRAADGRLHELWWVPGGFTPAHRDLTAGAAPLAADRPAAFALPAPPRPGAPLSRHVAFRGANNHIYEITMFEIKA